MLIATTLPLLMVFYRVPVKESGPTADRAQAQPSQGAASTAAAELAAAAIPIPKSPDTSSVAIFGSVSKAEIADAAKAVLAQSEEGKRVVLGAEDITFTETEGDARGIEGDRLKTLGDFPIEIRVKMGEAVQRVVSVRAQEDSEARLEVGRLVE